MNFKQLIALIGVISIIVGTLVFVKAQIVGRISAECGATSVNHYTDYKVYASEGFTNYRTTFVAGICRKVIQGRVNAITNVQNAIDSDIRSRIVSEDMRFRLSPYEDNQVDGRFTGSIS